MDRLRVARRFEPFACASRPLPPGLVSARWTALGLQVALVVLSVGCGASPSQVSQVQEVDRTSSGIATGPVEPIGAWTIDEQWTTLRGLKIHAVTISPAEVIAGRSLRVEGAVSSPTSPCELWVSAVPSRAQSEQGIWRGRGSLVESASAAQSDPRSTAVLAQLTAEGFVATLDIPEELLGGAVVIELEHRCASQVDPLDTGPRRELVVNGELIEGAHAVLAMLPLARRPRQVVAMFSSADLLADGVLDEPVWQRAPVYRLMQSLDGEPVDDRGEGTRVRFVWTPEALWLGAEIDDSDLWSEFEHDDDNLWERDVLEWFLQGREGTPYLELQLSPRGRRFDARWAKRREGQEDWDGPWRSGQSIQGTVDAPDNVDSGWSAELAVPWSALSSALVLPGAVDRGLELRSNVYRIDQTRGPNGNLGARGSALGPTFVPDFHALKHAPVLRLESEPPSPL